MDTLGLFRGLRSVLRYIYMNTNVLNLESSFFSRTDSD